MSAATVVVQVADLAQQAEASKQRRELLQVIVARALGPADRIADTYVNVYLGVRLAVQATLVPLEAELEKLELLMAGVQEFGRG
jgi:hypothetical protein